MGEKSSDMTDRFAGFVESFAFDQIPEPVIVRTKQILFDGLGCVLSATSPRYDIGTVLKGSDQKRAEARNAAYLAPHYARIVLLLLW